MAVYVDTLPVEGGNKSAPFEFFDEVFKRSLIVPTKIIKDLPEDADGESLLALLRESCAEKITALHKEVGDTKAVLTYELQVTRGLKLSGAGKPLLIIAEDVDGESLAALIGHKFR